jgi:hypothetical protein
MQVVLPLIQILFPSLQTCVLPLDSVYALITVSALVTNVAHVLLSRLSLVVSLSLSQLPKTLPIRIQLIPDLVEFSSDLVHLAIDLTDLALDLLAFLSGKHALTPS